MAKQIIDRNREDEFILTLSTCSACKGRFYFYDDSPQVDERYRAAFCPICGECFEGSQELPVENPPTEPELVGSEKRGLW